MTTWQEVESERGIVVTVREIEAKEGKVKEKESRGRVAGEERGE